LARKLMVIGLDAAPPKLIYEQYEDELPTISKLMVEGCKAELRSTHPPITIPAWASMVTGKTPGELGMYGFRHKKPKSYTDFYIANSKFIKHPTVWDKAGERGLKSIVVGVPPGYPPKQINGFWVSCFITPSNKSQYTYPPKLKREIEEKFGSYQFDVVFRTEERDKLIKELWEMTRYHFKVLRWLAQKSWDFFMFVEIGVDRVQHAFWGYMDPEHHKYKPGNKYEKTILEYYKLIDSELEKLLKNTPKDAAVMVISDHGAKRMKGAFCINQWLAEKGYLKLKSKPSKPGIELAKVDVDWSNTIAWGWGGYYARIYLNLEGREAKGIIKQKDYEHYRDELAEEIRKIKGPNGEKWETKVYKPEELYPKVRGDPPDLIVYLDDLYWRSAGTLGWETKYLRENDRGPDDAVHDWNGIIVVYDPEKTVELKNEMVEIARVHEIMLKLLEIGE